METHFCFSHMAVIRIGL